MSSGRRRCTPSRSSSRLLAERVGASPVERDHHLLDAVLDEEGGVGGGGADVDPPSSSKRVTRATPTPMKTGSMPRRYRDGVDVTPLDRRLVREGA